MTVRMINTPDEFRAIRNELVPSSLSTKTGDRILVPCTAVLLVSRALIVANDYNPNSVAPDRMELLKQSIIDNGFCFPVVSIWNDEQDKFIVVDGYHRFMILGPDWLDCDHVPVVVLTHDISRRLAATWQFNKARGVHQVDLDAELIRRLLEQGLDEKQVAERLGVDLDTVHRYKQTTGIAELFKNSDYSLSWEMVDDDLEDGQKQGGTKNR